MGTSERYLPAFGWNLRSFGGILRPTRVATQAGTPWSRYACGDHAKNQGL
jgi:hypothetical protein